MEHVERICDISDRAQAIGTSLRALCVAEGVVYATVWRWRRPEGNPQTRLMTETLERLERRLGATERALLSALIRRHPDAARNAA